MDALLSRYLLHEVSNITMDFVCQLLVQVKKQDICTYVTHFVCVHALTENVWILQKIKAYYEMVKTYKPSEKQKLVKVFYALFHMIAQCDKATYIFHNLQDKSGMFIDDIKGLIYNSNHIDIPETMQLKDVLSDEVYSLINIMYDCFLYSVESKVALQKCFLIMRYLLTLLPKQYLASGQTSKSINMDITDFMFLACILYTNQQHCPADIKLYVTTCKDIFYYKARKKDKLARVNLIFYTIYAIINKKVINQPLDYEGMNFEFTTTKKGTQCTSSENGDLSADVTQESSKACKINNSILDEQLNEKLSYLFIYMDYDEYTSMNMQRERERLHMMSKLMRDATKEIEVDYLLTKDSREYVSVAKLH